MRRSAALSDRTTFTYDPANRLRRSAALAGLTTYTYDAANRLRRSAALSGLTTYTYDAAGNQRTIEEPTGDVVTNTWSYENQNTLVEQPSGDRVTLTYNGDKMQVAREDADESRRFEWDKHNLLLETDDLGTPLARNTHEPDDYGRLVSREDLTTSEPAYYHYDALGSTAALSDASEVVGDEYQYKAWGEQTAPTADPQPYRWVGELGYRYDEDTNRHNLRRRDYDSHLAQFLSQDPPEGDDDPNGYRYTANNPTNAVDPSGKAPENIPSAWMQPAPGWSAAQWEAMIRSLFANGVYHWIENGTQYQITKSTDPGVARTRLARSPDRKTVFPSDPDTRIKLDELRRITDPDWVREFEILQIRMDHALRKLQTITDTINERLSANPDADINELLDEFERTVEDWISAYRQAHALIAAGKVSINKLEVLLTAKNPASLGVSFSAFPGMLSISPKDANAIASRLDENREALDAAAFSLKATDVTLTTITYLTAAGFVVQAVKESGKRVVFKIAGQVALGIAIGKQIDKVCDRFGISEEARKIALIVADVAQLILIRRKLRQERLGSVPEKPKNIVSRVVAKVLGAHKVVWDRLRGLFKLCSFCSILEKKIEKAIAAATDPQILKELRDLLNRVKKAQDEFKRLQGKGLDTTAIEAHEKQLLAELEEIASRDVRVAEALKAPPTPDEQVPNDSAPVDAPSTTGRVPAGAGYDPHVVAGPNPNNLQMRVVDEPSADVRVYLKPHEGKTKVGSTGGTNTFRTRYTLKNPEGGGPIEVEIPQTRFSKPAGVDDSAYEWTSARQRRFDEEYVDRLTPESVRYRAPTKPQPPVSQEKWDQFRHIFGYGDVPSDFGR